MPVQTGCCGYEAGMDDLPGCHGQPDPAGDRIESYLDELLLTLRGRPRDARRLLSEVEDHLRDSVAAGVAAGQSRLQATEEALRRFGPPSAVARGLPPRAAWLALLGQLVEAALFVIGVVGVAAGAAAVPAAVLGLSGDASLVTGDRPGQALAAGRCHQLMHLTGAPGCAQALSDHHLQEVIRNHLLGGWLGLVVIGVWWAVHVHRRNRPTVLPAGFPLTVCSTLLGVVAVFLVAIGGRNVAYGVASTDGLIGSDDLVATGASMLAAALLCGVVLARQATGWPPLPRLARRRPGS